MALWPPFPPLGVVVTIAVPPAPPVDPAALVFWAAWPPLEAVVLRGPEDPAAPPFAPALLLRSPAYPEPDVDSETVPPTLPVRPTAAPPSREIPLLPHPQAIKIERSNHDPRGKPFPKFQQRMQIQ
jgi:hypothetical protein